MATELKSLPPCFVCNKPVHLESATTDEQGRIVHGECYFLKIISAKPMRTNREESKQVNRPNKSLPAGYPLGAFLRDFFSWLAH
jgi:hypothetical protein